MVMILMGWPVHVDEEDDNAITIPQTTLVFNDADYSLLQQRIDPNGQTDNYGIAFYEHPKRFFVPKSLVFQNITKIKQQQVLHRIHS